MVIFSSWKIFFQFFMSVLIESLIWNTSNGVLDIELTYRVTRNLFKLVKQFISSFQILRNCVLTSLKIFYQLLFLFLFLHDYLNRFMDFKDFYISISILYWFNTKNTETCDRKGLHHDLEIFHARGFVRFFGISSTPMQSVTCSEFLLIIIVK